MQSPHIGTHTDKDCKICAIIDQQIVEQPFGWRHTVANLTGQPVDKLPNHTASAPLPCVYRGAEVDRRKCDSCRNSIAIINSCEIHGRCTMHTKADFDGVKRCRDCKDIKTYPTLKDSPPDMMKINHGAGGLGDALLGLVVTKSLQTTGKKVAYAVHARAIPFVQLFDGADFVAQHVHDKTQPGAPDEHLQLNLGYMQECQSRAAIPRWERYARNVGAPPTPILPVLREPDRLKALGKAHAGSVVLVPFGASENRSWHLQSWLTLESLLAKAGYKVVILDNQPERTKAFKSEKVLNAGAERVTGMLLNAAAVVANDSGIAHLAGITGCPTIAVCSHTDGSKIFALYPRMTILQGKLDCDKCWWVESDSGGKFNPNRCGQTCASLATILPADVVREVDQIVLPTLTIGRSIISTDRLTVLRDTVRATAHLSGAMAEAGSYQGGSARLIAVTDPKRKLHVFDALGLPADDSAPGGRHKAGEFAGTEAMLRETLAGQNVEIRIGHFRDTTKMLPDDLQFSFIHLDLDCRDDTEAALRFFWPRMVPGAACILDDFDWHCCPGIRTALEAFLPDVRPQQLAPGQCIIWK